MRRRCARTTSRIGRLPTDARQSSPTAGPGAPPRARRFVSFFERSVEGTVRQEEVSVGVGNARMAPIAVAAWALAGVAAEEQVVRRQVPLGGGHGTVTVEVP